MSTQLATTNKYRDKFQLLNKAEQKLYKLLCEAAPNYIVFTQVSMSQVFYGLDEKKLFAIGKKSIDFLLCRKDDTSMVLAVELNGIHHQEESQIISDGFKNDALKQAGIPLLILDPAKIPEKKELGRILATAVHDRKKNEETKQAGIEKAKRIKAIKHIEKPTCDSCKTAVSPKVITFCQAHKEHFKNKILCSKCQREFALNGNQ